MESGGAIIICRILAPPPSPQTPQFLTIVMPAREGDAIIFVGFWRPPAPTMLINITIIMTERGGAIIICRILAPPNAPPPQTPQYYNYLNDREREGAIIFLMPPMPLPLFPTPQYLTILMTGKGGGGRGRQYPVTS